MIIPNMTQKIPPTIGLGIVKKRDPGNELWGRNIANSFYISFMMATDLENTKGFWNIFGYHWLKCHIVKTKISEVCYTHQICWRCQKASWALPPTAPPSYCRPKCINKDKAKREKKKNRKEKRQRRKIFSEPWSPQWRQCFHCSLLSHCQCPTSLPDHNHHQ